VAVGEVPSAGKIHGKHGLARLQDRKIHRHIRLRPGMRLDIGMLGSEKLLCPLNCQGFDGIDILAAAVPTVVRITFGIFIRQDAPLRFHDCQGSKIFRSDQLQILLLPPDLLFNRLVNLRVCLFNMLHCRHRIFFSSFLIRASLRLCLPASNSVFSQTRAIRRASRSFANSEPRTRTLLSLCCRERRAAFTL